MLLTLDLNDPRPLHEQVAAAIRRAITAGDVAPGDRLPPARDLADALGVNANTVLRSLRELRDEGLLEFRRGRGVSVLRRPDGREALRTRVRELLDEAAGYGLTADDVITLIKDIKDIGEEPGEEPGGDFGKETS
ncbi:GntR family transcriptional regulator [Microbispora rosea subsp. aerata]|nr:GntR family transcriptional regulator [Microbispora rosea]GGO09436.1 GntR family transcriptional regulator [Microbispora rosea subsp. aerata]GIH53476.1 GntR family transcriptional regulator [Microbispora rosea subsp. aerata]GLJ85474.1 GntR family transcriptional regulator [Microbispora rosea subsp. aerata]